MNLANYISDLLYRYECVIIPNFGGFVTNDKSARISKANNTIYPPYKQLTFNSHLKNNDGLLANYISSSEDISYECAVNFIQFETDSWMEKLRSQDLSLQGLGTFSLVEGKLHFEPQLKINYLTSSFGLSNVIVNEIAREEQPGAIEEKHKAPVIPMVQRKTPQYLKYAAAFVLGISLIGLGGRYYQGMKNDQMVVEAQKQQEAVEQKIENATFVIAKPLPALNIELERSSKKFHVIAGAFRFPENADRKVKQLLEEGYEARILGVNRWNLTVVSYGSYETRAEAVETLYGIRKNVAKDSWLLIQEF